MGLIDKLRTRPAEAAKVLAVVVFGGLFAWLGTPKC